MRLGLSFFALRTHKALAEYKNFISHGVDPKTLSFYNKKNQGPILGDPDFLKRIKEKYIYGRQGLSSEIPEARRLKGATVVERIMKEVSVSYKKPKEELLLSKRGQSHPARLMALCLCREFSGLTLPEIAACFKINSYKTVNSGCQRFKSYLAKDRKMGRRYDKIYRRCMQGEI